MYRHILVPLDGSEIAEQVLPHVEELAGAFGARVTIVRVIRPVDTVAGVPVATEERWLAEEEVDAVPYLEQVERRLRERGLDVRVMRPRGPVAATIVAQTVEQEADLIAMTTHGRTGLLRLALGSVAEEVIRQAPCPVLLVRAH
jgi:nucleotide-binding universal stress UspA family protein